MTSIKRRGLGIDLFKPENIIQVWKLAGINLGHKIRMAKKLPFISNVHLKRVSKNGYKIIKNPEAEFPGFDLM